MDEKSETKETAARDPHWLPRLVRRLVEEADEQPLATAEGMYRRALLLEAAEEIRILRIALADAIRRPMGVIPASAEGHITNEELDRAEEHRQKFPVGGKRNYTPNAEHTNEG